MSNHSTTRAFRSTRHRRQVCWGARLSRRVGECPQTVLEVREVEVVDGRANRGVVGGVVPDFRAGPASPRARIAEF